MLRGAIWAQRTNCHVIWDGRSDKVICRAAYTTGVKGEGVGAHPLHHHVALLEIKTKQPFIFICQLFRKLKSIVCLYYFNNYFPSISLYFDLQLFLLIIPSLSPRIRRLKVNTSRGHFGFHLVSKCLRFRTQLLK